MEKKQIILNITTPGTCTISPAWQSNEHFPEDVHLMLVTITEQNLRDITIAQEFVQCNEFVAELHVEVESIQLLREDGKESDFAHEYKHTTIKLFRDQIAYLYVWGKYDPSIQLESESFYINKDSIQNRMIVLKSVGCGVDPETGITYAQYKNNKYDMNSGVHLKDCEGEWRDLLSKKDATACRQVIKNLYQS